MTVEELIAFLKNCPDKGIVMFDRDHHLHYSARSHGAWVELLPTCIKVDYRTKDFRDE